MGAYIKHIDLLSKDKHELNNKGLLLIDRLILAPNTIFDKINHNGVESMEQGIIIYHDPEEFLRVIEQLRQAYNKSKL